MHRLRLSASLLGAIALAACSADRPEPLSPLAPPATSRSSVSPSTGRYILGSNGKFANDLAARVAALGGELVRVHDAGGIAIVSGISDLAAAQLRSIGGVNDVEPDLDIALQEPVAPVRADASAMQNPGINSAADPTTASRYSWQWNMRDIHADAAWAAGKLGDAGVTVAILDTGIDYDAPDLAGLVDLDRSVSFVPFDDAITTTYFPTRHPISDYNGHGTNVATQVSSKARAIAGVTSRTTLIGVKVLNGRGSGSLGSLLNGILWAADHGADVANMSLGVPGGVPKAGNGAYISLVNKVFNYAKQKGMLMVVSAGNDAMDVDHNGNIFAAYCDAPHVVCVSSVGPALAQDLGTPAVDAPAYYSNAGRSAISVAAPGGNADAAHGFPNSAWPWGVDVASWVWSYCSKTTLVFSATGQVLGYAGCQSGNFLTGFIGTSQASPHVAGLAALLVAETGHGQPQQIKQAIEQSADDLGQNGTDPFYGRGRINVAKAIGF